jgi:hypothetical protein
MGESIRNPSASVRKQCSGLTSIGLPRLRCHPPGTDHAFWRILRTLPLSIAIGAFRGLSRLRFPWREKVVDAIGAHEK